MMARLRLRVLPLTILVIGGLLVLKVSQFAHPGSAPAAIASASRALMAPAQAAGGAVPGKAAPVSPAAAPPQSATLPNPDAPPAEPPVNEAERAVLLDLRARRTVLEQREQAMVAREAMQAAAERRLNERLTQLTALQAKLEQLDKLRRERDDANWRGLVKTYEAMRPRDAAAILNELETPVLLEVLDRMKEAKAAQVLAAMQPDRARAATAGLAQLRTRSVASPIIGPQG